MQCPGRIWYFGSRWEPRSSHFECVSATVSQTAVRFEGLRFSLRFKPRGSAVVVRGN